MGEQAMLSNHFSFNELTASAAHPELDEKNRLEAAAFADPLHRLCEGLLEPVREQFGPVVILSGFRCPALNAAIKGAGSSQHLLGEAADFYVPTRQLDSVFQWIRASKLQYGQVIREPGWIHLSLGEPYRPAEKCRQALVFDGKTYKTAI